MPHDLPEDDLLTNKTLNLKDPREFKSISLSIIREQEPVNNFTSVPVSTVKASAVSLASEWQAVVSDNKAF